MTARRSGRLMSSDRPAPQRRRLCSVESLRLPDGRQICVRRWRGQDGDILVVLHGLLDSSEGWDALCANLTVGVVALDLPGFGQSDPPPRGSIAVYARDVADALATLGIERFTLVGHSLGGAVAAAVAELVPEKVAGLVLLAPVGFGRLHLAEAASAPIARTLVEMLLPWALSSRIAVTAAYVTMVTNGRLPDPQTVRRVTSRGRSLVAGTREAVRAIAAVSRCSDRGRPAGAAYEGPVAAVWGDRDRLVPASHRGGLLAALPQARVHLWTGMGHHPVAERFDELTALFADVAPAAAARAA